MPNTGIEPATLRSLARRSNQLSYAAANILKSIIYLLTYQSQIIYNLHSNNLQLIRQLSVVQNILD